MHISQVFVRIFLLGISYGFLLGPAHYVRTQTKLCNFEITRVGNADLDYARSQLDQILRDSQILPTAIEFQAAKLEGLVAWTCSATKERIVVKQLLPVLETSVEQFPTGGAIVLIDFEAPKLKNQKDTMRRLMLDSIIAHEIGHIKLGHAQPLFAIPKRQKEEDSDEFAGRILGQRSIDCSVATEAFSIWGEGPKNSGPNTYPDTTTRRTAFNRGCETSAKPRSEFDLGYSDYLNGKKKEAIKHFNRALNGNPRLAAAYFWRGNSHYDEGGSDHLQLAINDYDKFLTFEPLNSLAFSYRGGTYLKLARKAKGETRLEYLEKAIADNNEGQILNPYSAFAWFNLGEALSESGNYNDAVAAYTSAIGLDNRYVAAYRGRGDAYSQLKLMQKSKADIETVNHLRP